MTYKAFLGAAVAAFLAVHAVEARVAEPIDLVIRGGLVFDGRSNQPVAADVVIRGDRIIAVGKAPEDGLIRREIDATGLWIAPGFIDTHTHYQDDLTSSRPATRLVPSALLQGVTTVFVGNDGTSYGRGIGRLFASADDQGIGPNMASYLGFGTVRRKVIGQGDRAATEAEVAEMTAMVTTAMCEGALGLSTGLFYAPQSFASTGEVIALAKEAHRHGGVYDSHIRDESSYGIGLKAAIEEAINIGRATGIPVHIGHIKALGVDVHGMAGEVIEQVEAAQAEGLTVHADQYPWEASGTSFGAAVLPRWVQADGQAATVARLEDPAQAARIREEMADNIRRRGGAASLLLTSARPDEAKGKTLAEIATLWNTDEVEAAIRLVKAGGARVASFNQTEADIRAFMVRPWVMTSSDATKGHPRRNASFARLYDHYVKREGVLTPAEFVNRSATLTAETFGLEGRGRVAEGYFADLAIFDPETFAPRATYLEPDLTAVGMVHVVVNGQVVVTDGEVVGSLNGRPLRRPSAAGCSPAG